MRSWFLVLAISVLVLAGCQPQEEVVSVTPRVVPTATPLPTGTATAVKSQLSVTPNPTSTPSPIILMTETAVFTTSLPPVAESTSLSVSEELITFDGSSFPVVPITNTNVSEYQLTSPDSTILVQTIGLTMLDTCHYDPADRSIEGDARDIFRMLKYEYDQLDENDQKGTVWLVENTGLCLGWSGYSYFVPTVIPQALEIGVVQFLNQEQIKFEPFAQTLPEFNFRAIPIDYDQRYKEWLLEVIFLRYNLRIFVPVYEDDLGIYHLTPNEF